MRIPSPKAARELGIGEGLEQLEPLKHLRA